VHILDDDNDGRNRRQLAALVDDRVKRAFFELLRRQIEPLAFVPRN
jgi:hypothetical protein